MYLCLYLYHSISIYVYVYVCRVQFYILYLYIYLSIYLSLPRPGYVYVYMSMSTFFSASVCIHDYDHIFSLPQAKRETSRNTPLSTSTHQASLMTMGPSCIMAKHFSPTTNSPPSTRLSQGQVVNSVTSEISDKGKRTEQVLNKRVQYEAI